MDYVKLDGTYRGILQTEDLVSVPNETAWPDDDIIAGDLTVTISGVAHAGTKTITKSVVSGETGKHTITVDCTGVAAGTVLELSGVYFIDSVRYRFSEEIYVDGTGIGAGLTDAQAAKIALIGTGTAIVTAPVSGDGDLLELIKDTDYLAANARALEWTFDEITGITTSATGKFGITNPDDATEVYVNSVGVVTEPSAGTFKVSFDIANTALSALTPGRYDWSVEVLEGTTKITIARNRQVKTRVDIVEKQT